ncbi:MAG: helix-turn-helix transcriptional regulator [Clostridia bacterium]|nr:helix-turn-helix transcriptional regulator [Clostridia bacterium]
MTFTLHKDIHIEHTVRSEGKSMATVHEHAYYEIYFLISGKRRYLMRDTVYDVEPRDLVLIPKNQLHRAVSATKEGYDRYVVYFTDHQAEQLMELMGKRNFETLIHQGCIRLPQQIYNEVLQELKQLQHLQDTQPPYADALSTHLFQGIMLQFLQHGIKKERLNGIAAEKVQLITQYISHNYKEEITLSSAAEMAGFEKTYFSKLFRSITGFGFQDYLLQTRILAAEPLLKDPTRSINDVAEACGFSSGNYFGDVFKRYRGISPTEYKKTFE